MVFLRKAEFRLEMWHPTDNFQGHFSVAKHQHHYVSKDNSLAFAKNKIAPNMTLEIRELV